LTWRATSAALLVGGVMVVPATAVAADDVQLTFRDPRITESSGLVDLGLVLVTTNDSGSSSKLYVVSPVTGKTVGITDYHANTVDVEALAPAAGGAVWVGDIGDNRAVRRSISVYRVKVGTGPVSARPMRFRLAYPGGARNAESMVADRQGRLYVITKSFTGGTVYRAPLPLDPKRVNRLQPVGRVIEYATDAALLPDGRHLIVRGPGRASVYTFPTFQRLGSLVLPSQRQGEGISVGPGSRILLSGEGKRSAVRRIALPPVIVQRMQPPATTPSPAPSATPSAAPSGSPAPSGSASGSPAPRGSASASAAPTPGETRETTDTSESEDSPWLMWSIPVVIVLGAVGIGLGLRRRAD
jgi:hypothetical protein